jgi:hypothetical protein
MTRTRFGDYIPDEYDAEREGRSASRWARNPYDDFGVSRAEEEAHESWERGQKKAEDDRRDEERRSEERQMEERREREAQLEADRLEYEHVVYEEQMEAERNQEEQP